MEPGELIGRGYQCDVFALGEDKVLKVFKPGADRSWIEREFRVTRVLHEAGLPVPAVFDIVDINGRAGIVYERIHGPLISDLALANPGKVKPLARGMAELHANIHSVTIKGLPSQRERLISRVRGLWQITSEEKESILGILDGLPDGDVVCHGDLNLNNVIVSPKGMVAIDWDNGCSGNPLADVARTVLLLDNAHCYFDDPSERTAVDALAKRFRGAYLDRYLEIATERTGQPATAESVAKWIIPVAAVRLDENIAQEQDALLEIARKGIARLV
ncbi:MAG TPA: phosphotransferase [Firmicutes bacterium]|mgnify:CR=1 FL=1|nr:phosphotransferase [Candidatus Fermentithermobacillaceae bacterium]